MAGVGEGAERAEGVGNDGDGINGVCGDGANAAVKGDIGFGEVAIDGDGVKAGVMDGGVEGERCRIAVDVEAV